MGDPQYYVRSRGRISGPFDMASLRKLRRRGVISRIDQYSADRVVWMSQTEFELNTSNSTEKLESVPQHDLPSANADDKNPAQYYYLNDGKVVGPVPAVLLARLAELGKLRPHDVVWRHGAENRARADSLPWLAICMNVTPASNPANGRSARRTRPIRMLYYCITGSALAIALIWIASTITSDDRTPPEKWLASISEPQTKSNTAQAGIQHNPSTNPIEQIITGTTTRPSIARFVSSALDENAMGEAVGLVVVGLEYSSAAGRLAQKPFASGSCFTISAEGYVITNKHVIESVYEPMRRPELKTLVHDRIGADAEARTWIFFGGREYPAEVSYLSEKYDLAILKTQPHAGPIFRLSGLTDGHRGESVYAAGFPEIATEPLSEAEVKQSEWFASNEPPNLQSQFKRRDFEFTLTTGMVSRPVTEATGQRWLQHEAVVRHGNSGGPLLDKNGVVIAINTAVQTNEEGDVQTNMSLEISQLRAEIETQVRGTSWVSP